LNGINDIWYIKLLKPQDKIFKEANMKLTLKIHSV